MMNAEQIAALEEQKKLRKNMPAKERGAFTARSKNKKPMYKKDLSKEAEALVNCRNIHTLRKFINKNFRFAEFK